MVEWDTQLWRGAEHGENLFIGKHKKYTSQDQLKILTTEDPYRLVQQLEAIVANGWL